jgi:DNA polymerase
MSDETGTASTELSAFARIAEYLEYQNEIGGSPITTQQGNALSSLFRERMSRNENAPGETGDTTRKATEPSSLKDTATTESSQEKRSTDRHRTQKRKGQSTSRKEKKRRGGLPSVEEFRSKETGRLPWETAPEEVAAASSSEEKSGGADEEMPAQKSASSSEQPVDGVAASEPPGPDTGGEKESLHEIREALGDCTRCRLCEDRENIVFGVGSENARLMFIGEAPGYHEDQQAEPFVGKAGQLLDKMISAMGLKREDVYIANVLKCRPPNNRNPKPDEVAHCSPFLKRQIHSVDPEVIITLGKFAATFVLGRELSITRTRGTWQTSYDRSVMPTLHPSYLLRRPEAKRDAWHDLQAVMEKLGLESPAS